MTATATATLDMQDAHPTPQPPPVTPPTAGDLAAALLYADNILRDIRLSHQEGILAERADYHMTHIDRCTEANHLMFCEKCRSTQPADPAIRPQSDAQTAALRARMAETIAPIPPSPVPVPMPAATASAVVNALNTDFDPAPHSRAATYELTGSDDTMAGLASILTVMGVDIPHDCDVLTLALERGAVLEALRVGQRILDRTAAVHMITFAAYGRPGRRASAALHRLDLAMSILRTAAGLPKA